MTILDELLAELDGRGSRPAREVRIGPFWTVVWGDHGCGLASTLMPGDHAHGSVFVSGAGGLTSVPLGDLAALARSDSTLEAGIGLAAINSMLAADEVPADPGNAGDYLIDAGRDRDVVLIGHFPFVPALRASARSLHVLELRPRPGDERADRAPEIVPRADLLAITGCTLINHTLDRLLALRKPGARVVLLGPTAPLSPILFRHGVDVVCGTRVVDPRAAVRSVTEGSTFPQVAGVELLMIRNSP